MDKGIIHLVDDDSSVRGTLARLLVSGGYLVRVYSSGAELIDAAQSLTAGCILLDVNMPGLAHEASNGPEALRLLRTDLPLDLMFTDVIMPEGMTGYELAGLARESRPGLRILFTSGYTAIVGQENDSRAGGTLLSKPYRKRDLAHFVRAALDEVA